MASGAPGWFPLAVKRVAVLVAVATAVFALIPRAVAAAGPAESAAVASTPRSIYIYDASSKATTVAAKPRINRALVERRRTERWRPSASSFTSGLAAKGAAGRLAESGFVDPSTIKFSQRSIGSKFRNGQWINELVENLRSGAVDPSDVAPIRIYAKDGAYVSLHNRRLEAFLRDRHAVTRTDRGVQPTPGAVTKMLTRSEALHRIQSGIEEWTDLEPEKATFVFDERLEHHSDEVVTHASNLLLLDSEDDWRDLLDPARTWLNATLHFDTEGRPVISLRAGPRRAPEEVDPQADVPIAVSMEPKPLRLVR